MTTRPIRLFILCADNDDVYMGDFEKHLSTLQRHQLIDAWHRRRIAPGDDITTQMALHLDQADIIVLAVSADFLASDYIHDVQLVRAIQRHTAGTARVVPLILRPVSWRLTSFGHLSPLPRDGRAVETWQHKDEAWLDVVNEIERVAREVREGMILSAENSSLRVELASVLARDRELLLERDSLTKELLALRDTHRRFDAEVQAATTEQRVAARSAQAQVTDLTVRLGEALRDLDFYRIRADTLSSQRQEQQAQINRLTEELRELKAIRDLLIWKSEAHLYVCSGGLQRDSGERFTVRWAFAVENIGRHAVRMVDAHVTWCFVDPSDTSVTPIDLNSDPYILTFGERPMVEPGKTSAAYVAEVNTKDIDAEQAKKLAVTIQPRVRVVYEGVRVAHRSSSERLLERESQLDQ